MAELNLKEKIISNYEDEMSELEDELKTLKYREEYKGILIVKFVNCGKKGCKCQRGEPHGPYVYRQYYEKGKKKQHYVPKKEVSKIADIVNENQRVIKIKARINELKRLIKQEEKQ